MGATYKITPEVAAEMQRDRDAGMTLVAQARKYGVSVQTIGDHIGRQKRRWIPRDTIAAMRRDRGGGMPVAAIAEKYGVSKGSASEHTKSADGPNRRDILKHPITAAELEAYRAGLRVGGQLDLQVMQYDEAGIQTGFKRERCRIEHVSRHVVVFRRPNGRTEHRTIVELCQAGRGG